MHDHQSHLLLTRRRLLQLAGGMGAAFVASPTHAASAVGAIAELHGEAMAEAGGARRALKIKSPVALGDTLATAKLSRLRAALGGKTTLRLGAETKVRIDRFLVDSGGELVLGSGALLLDAPAGNFPKGLAVESAFALIAVRGTRFFAGPIDGVFGVFVSRGWVDVTAGGKRVRLKSGEGTDIKRAGDPPGPVKVWGQPKIRKAFALVR